MRTLLTDTAALKRVNATTVFGAIIRWLTEKGVNFDQVGGFVFDGARYITAPYRKCRQHNCSAPVIYLVREILR